MPGSDITVAGWGVYNQATGKIAASNAVKLQNNLINSQATFRTIWCRFRNQFTIMQPATAFGAASPRTCSVQLLKTASTAAKETQAAPSFVTEFKSVSSASDRRYAAMDQRRLFMWESRRQLYAISSEAPLEFEKFPHCRCDRCDSIKLIFSWTLFGFKLPFPHVRLENFRW